ncbi:subtilisin-like protease SBT5.6 [Tripterygium wilfordii]|uniref:subtilisin-like protease SBT5.6 n=1 Tax=Tripterygium wilfordii TaxID=458696 RepID=UPI0018F802F0|nr:subtilisin-like protease SBT5.6 [Tripterygium wilfordii]
MKLIGILFVFLLPLLASCAEKKVYIVYLGGHKGDNALHQIEETHRSYLSSVKDTEEEATTSLIYSYKHSINGFAASLTPDEAQKLSGLEGVISVFESHPRKYSLQTTRSWEFIGLGALTEEEGEVHNQDNGKDLLLRAKYGTDVIVGLIDSGVWPESESFNDEGMGPIPKSWKGICQSGSDFNSSHCNRKIIGARYYIKNFEQYYGPLNTSEDTLSPRDLDGHGTHTASTATGRRVENVSVFDGLANGTASGGAPLSRLAIYKVCWAKPNQSKADGNECFLADIMAGMDDAVGDGVHIMSISIATSEPIPYEEDGTAIGALHAAKKNIVVVCAAGNSGPGPGTLSNVAPWMITVGASSVDRVFHGPLKLGNGVTIMGQSVTPYKLDKMYPLIFAGDAEKLGTPKNATGYCLAGSLSPGKVEGKIVLCYRGQGSRVRKGEEVKSAGGIGLVLGNLPVNGDDVVADAHLLPATALTASDTTKVFNLIKSTKNLMATIGAPMTVLHNRPAPSMAGFTSRGPSTIDPYILKPDVTAPGVNILAGWSEASSPTKLVNDHRVVKYYFDSGTSMATPHVAGTAALIKAIHPEWSSAAIRSSLMTTAWMRNNVNSSITDYNGDIATPFAFGSGHFRPTKATDPGLVYDASYTDYLIYLCSGGLKNSSAISYFDPTFKCPKVLTPLYNLNYPSLALPNITGTIEVKRTVTNVGYPRSTYFFSSDPPLGISVRASPSVLFFDQVGQKKSFTITVTPSDIAREYHKGDYAFGWYTWDDNYHNVRSPMAVSLA